MTTAQDQFSDALKEGQNVMTQGVRAWQDAVTSVTSTVVQNMQKLGVPSVPTPQVDSGYVDSAFNVADQLLDIQRTYAKSVLQSSVPAMEAASRTARETTEAFQHAVQDSAKAVQHAAGSVAESTAGKKAAK